MIVRRLRRTGVRDPGPSLSVTRAAAKRYGSARALAETFGSPIFEPTWWPEDIGAVTYCLDRWPSSVVYRIGSTRHDGAPICVIGGPENQTGQLAKGNWYTPPELEGWRGLVSTSGAHVHAVVHDEQQIIHLIGYTSEAEVVRAVKSLRRVPPE